MKSRLFKDLDPSPRERATFGERIRALVALDDETWKKLSDFVPKIRETPRGQQERVAQEFVRSTNVGRHAAAAVFSFTELIARSKLDETLGDRQDAVVADLVALAGNENAEPKLQRFVAHVHEHIAPQLQTIVRRERIYLGVIQSLASWRTVVELRANFGEGFEDGMDPERYMPSVIDMHPVATIRLETDEDEFLVFQCDEHMLAQFITRLQATLSELRVIRGTLQ